MLRSMNVRRYCSLYVLLCTVCALASGLPAATPVVPGDRDRQVLETLLLHLLADPTFDMTRVSTNGATIVLHTRTPEKTGFIQSHQMRIDIGDHTLPSDVERDLQRRNSKPGTYDAIEASFADLKFAPGIVVADLTDKRAGRRASRAFEETHPKARGWLEAYLPGYSKDGSRAVVRGGTGPSAHGAMVTALLEQSGDKWVVKWHFLAWYA